VIIWHLSDDHECTAELFYWSSVYNRVTGEDSEACFNTDDH